MVESLMRKPSACVNDMDTESGHARFGNIRLSPMGTSGGHAFPQAEQPAGPPQPPSPPELSPHERVPTESVGRFSELPLSGTGSTLLYATLLFLQAQIH